MTARTKPRHKHFARARETVIQALERAFENNHRVVMIHGEIHRDAISFDDALDHLRYGTGKFAVHVHGQLVPL